MKEKVKPPFWSRLSPNLRYQYDIIRQWPSETVEQYNRRYNDLLRKIENELKKQEEQEVTKSRKLALKKEQVKDVLLVILKVVAAFGIGIFLLLAFSKFKTT